jgi:hypothetical protein
MNADAQHAVFACANAATPLRTMIVLFAR